MKRFSKTLPVVAAFSLGLIVSGSTVFADEAIHPTVAQRAAICRTDPATDPPAPTPVKADDPPSSLRSLAPSDPAMAGP